MLESGEAGEPESSGATLGSYSSGVRSSKKRPKGGKVTGPGAEIVGGGGADTDAENGPAGPAAVGGGDGSDSFERGQCVGFPVGTSVYFCVVFYVVSNGSNDREVVDD